MDWFRLYDALIDEGTHSPEALADHPECPICAALAELSGPRNAGATDEGSVGG